MSSVCLYDVILIVRSIIYLDRIEWGKEKRRASGVSAVYWVRGNHDLTY